MLTLADLKFENPFASGRFPREGHYIAVQIWMAQVGIHCPECGCEMRKDLPYGHPRKATVDHIIPRCAGGTGHPRNLRVICERCNVRKSKKDPEAKKWIR